MVRLVRAVLLYGEADPLALLPGLAAAEPESDPTRTLDGLKVVQPDEHTDDLGRLVFTVGALEGVLPPGWSAMKVAGQTTYRSPDLQQTLRVFGYLAPTPLDEARQGDVLVALSQLARQAETMMGKMMKVEQSTPVSGIVPWGRQAGFFARGPLTRLGLHYATVSANEALMFQLDGNGEAHSPAQAAAIIRSLHRRQVVAPPAAPATK